VPCLEERDARFFACFPHRSVEQLFVWSAPAARKSDVAGPRI
jgi:hypothetical protein